MLLLGAHQLAGQSTFATITGSVTDSSGAIIAGAVIEIVQTGTNYQFKASSNEGGQFTVPYLRDGTYQLSATAPGFQSLKVDGIVVSSRENRRVDLQMQVGAVSSVVEVQGGQSLVETETARISDSKDREVMRALPLTLRRAWDYFTMTPQIERTGGFQIRFGGTGNNQGEATIDGTSIAGAGGSPIGPLLDRTELVQEMRIDIAQASAEQQTMGQVTLISRGGTNKFRGTIADYYATPAFRARNPFNNVRSTGRSHQMIFSAGGPVILPKIYNGKDKTFFFHTTEIAFGSLRNNAVNRTVPLDAWRTGDFRSIATPIRDPFNSGAPFAGNIIPPARLNTLSRTVQERFLFKPNFGNTDNFAVNNYRVTRLLPFVHQPTITNRIDHRISDKQFFYGRWTAVRWNFDAPVLNLPNIEGNGVSQRNMDTLTLAHTYTFSPSISNEFRYGLASQRQPANSPIRGKDLVSQLGIQGLAPNLPDVGGMTAFNFQNIAISGISATAACNPCGQDLVHSYLDNVTWIHGKHTMKMGANIRLSKLADLRQSGNLFGSVTFSDRFTGHPYADFLLGTPTTMQRDFPTIRQDRQRWSQGYYFSDEWKLRPNLTLTLGLRWDLHSPWTENNDLISVFDPRSGKIVVPDSALPKVNPLLPRGYVDVIGASAAGRPARTLLAADKNNFQPRLGFAWRPFNDNVTVVRGGFGMANNIAPRILTLVGVPFVIAEPAFTNPVDRPILLPNVFPPAGSQGPTSINIPAAVRNDLAIARVIQYSFTLEHQRWNTGFMATYNGTGTRQGVWRQNINQPRVDNQLFINKPRLFPNYPDVNAFDNGAGHQYNALTLQATRRSNNGLHYQAFWTWARDIGDMEDGEGPEDAYNRRRDRTWWERMPSHRLSGNVMYDLPYGKGRPWGSNANRYAKAVFGGWQLSAIVAVETGRALSPSWTGPDPTGTRFSPNNTRPIVTIRPDSTKNPNIDNPTVDRWFDLSAFGAPQIGSFGTAGRGTIIGAPTRVLHNSLAKYFTFKERLRLRLEFLATNTLNKPNYAEPDTLITNVASAGRITNVTDRNAKFDSAIPREIQGLIRLEW